MTITSAVDRLTIATRRGVLLLALLVTSCSLVLRGPPPRPVASDPLVRCDTSRLAPVLDTVMAFPLLVGGVAAFGYTAGCRHDPSQFDFCPTPKGPAVAASLGVVAVGGLFLWSAIRGFNKTGECREIIESQRACLAGVGPACDCLAGVGAGCDALGGRGRTNPYPISCASDVDCIDAGATCQWGTCKPPPTR